MNLSKLFIVIFFVVIFKQGSSVPIEKSDNVIKLKLLKLLASTALPQAADSSNSNFINNPNDRTPSETNKHELDDYNPDLFIFPDEFDESEEDTKKISQKFKDEPWHKPIATDENDFEQNDSSKENGFGVDVEENKKSASYEVTENPEDYLPSYPRHNQEKRGFYAGHKPGFGLNHGFYHGFNPHFQHNYDIHHNHGFYQHGADSFPFENRRPHPQFFPTTVAPSVHSPAGGFNSKLPGFNYGFDHQFHHNYDFHHNHGFNQHGADCFPFGNHRRPRPPFPPPTVAPTTTAFPIVDPRITTPAGIVSSEAPSIDIRLGRDTRRQQKTVVFPE